jgi:hypothetical protein
VGRAALGCPLRSTAELLPGDYVVQAVSVSI